MSRVRELDQREEPLKTRTGEWAKRIGVDLKEIHIRQMLNKWASASTAGRITLGTDVLGLKPDLQDYIVVHELIHLRVPNHGKLWKSLMRAYLGDYERYEQVLRLKGL